MSKSNMASFQLPLYELSHVLEYLSIKDRLTSASVCKSWHFACKESKLLHDISIYFNKENLLEALKEFKSMTRFFQLFYFDNCYINNEAMNFLENFALRATKMSFECCMFTCPLQLDKYQNLNLLQFFNCRNVEFQFKGELILRHLETIKFYQLSDKQLLPLCDVEMPKLREVKIADVDIYEPTASIEVSELSPAVFLQFFKRHCSSLRSLHIRCCSIELPILLSIIRLQDLDLLRISIPDCFTDDDELSIFPELFSLHPNLEELNINWQPTMYKQSQFIAQLSVGLPHIQELDLGCDLISEDSAIQLFQLKNLKKLRLYCIIPPFNFRTILKQSQIELECLDLIVTDIADEDVVALCNHFPRIKELYLKHCGFMAYDKDVTIIAVKHIFQLEYLRKLTLPDKCTNITEDSFISAIRNARCIELVELVFCISRVTDDTTKAVCDTFPKLEVLNMSGDSEIMTDWSEEMLKKINMKKNVFEYLIF